MHGYVEVVDSVVENHEKQKCENQLFNNVESNLCHLSPRDKADETALLPENRTHLSGRAKNNNNRVKINCEGSSLDSILNSVPLVYDPVTKQLFLNDGHNCSMVPKSSTSVINNGTVHLMGDGPSFQDSVHCMCLSKLSLSAGDEKDAEQCECKLQAILQDSSNTSTDRQKTCNVESSPQNDESECNGSTDDTQLLSTPASFSVYTDTSSVTSISSVSTGTEASVAPSEYTEGSDNAGIALCDSISQGSRGSPWKGAKPKKKGISSLLSRNIFPWKAKEGSESLSSLTPNTSPEVSRKLVDDCVASSTTALILENRPSYLPAKSYEEEQKHKQEYEEMVKAARKKEIREAKLKKKQLQQLRKQEDMLIQAIKIWTNEILPQWDAVKDTRKARDLWWQGIPPNVRGKVWKLAIGNDLNITPELFDICVTRSKEKIWTALPQTDCGENEDCCSGENSADLIKLDVSRTFPVLGIFQESGPYHEVLSCVLGAYVTYRPDIGYVQGMSFLAAMLLLNMESVDAFTCFANLLNKPCQLSFFRVDEAQMKAYYEVYEDFFSENLPKLFAHFNKQNLSTDLYLIDWIYTLYSRSLPLDIASRVWDVFFRDGEEFVFRAALGILRMYEDVLLQLDFIHIAQFLNKLPDDICSEQLFASIGAIKMNINKKQFSQTLLKRQAELASENSS